MKNNCTALVPAIARLLWQTTFLFLYPLPLFTASLSFAKFISHFHFVCHCRLAGFSSSITQRETAKNERKNPFAKTSHSGHLYIYFPLSLFLSLSLPLSSSFSCLVLALFASCLVELKLVARGAGCSLVDWKMFNQLLRERKKKLEPHKISSCVFSTSVVTPRALAVT